MESVKWRSWSFLGTSHEVLLHRAKTFSVLANRWLAWKSTTIFGHVLGAMMKINPPSVLFQQSLAPMPGSCGLKIH